MKYFLIYVAVIILTACSDKKSAAKRIENISETYIFFAKRISNIDTLVKSYSKDIIYYEDSLRIIRIAIYNSDLNEVSKDTLARYVDSISIRVESFNVEHSKKSIPFDQTLNIYSYFNDLYNLKNSQTSEITKLNGETINYLSGGIFRGNAELTIGNNNFSQLKACIIVLDNENCIYFSGNIVKGNSSFIYKAYSRSVNTGEYYPFNINFKKNKSGNEYIEFKSVKHKGTLQMQFFKQ